MNLHLVWKRAVVVVVVCHKCYFPTLKRNLMSVHIQLLQPQAERFQIGDQE